MSSSLFYPYNVQTMYPQSVIASVINIWWKYCILFCSDLFKIVEILSFSPTKADNKWLDVIWIDFTVVDIFIFLKAWT